MGQTKEFHLGDILSVTTGYLVSPNKMAGVHEILDFMEEMGAFYSSAACGRRQNF